MAMTMKTGNGVIGVGTWVEMSNNRWFLLDPRDPRSWFMFPWLTLMEALER